MILKFIFGLIFLCTNCFAVASINDTQQQEQIKKLTEQNIRLQEQNEIFKSSIEKTNNMFISSLSFAGMFLIAFFGINIYFVKNRADDDKKNLEHIINDRYNENYKKLSNTIQNQLNENIKTLEKNFSSQTKTISLQLDSKIDSITKKLKHVDYEISTIRYEKEQCAGNKLTAAMEVITCSEAIGYEWKTSKTLTEIQKLLLSGAEFDTHELSDVYKTLKNISEPNRNLALEVERMTLKSRTQE